MERGTSRKGRSMRIVATAPPRGTAAALGFATVLTLWSCLPVEAAETLNRAAAAMKHVFDPHLQRLDPRLEEDVSEPSVE